MNNAWESLPWAVRMAHEAGAWITVVSMFVLLPILVIGYLWLEFKRRR